MNSTPRAPEIWETLVAGGATECRLVCDGPQRVYLGPLPGGASRPGLFVDGEGDLVLSTCQGIELVSGRGRMGPAERARAFKGAFATADHYVIPFLHFADDVIAGMGAATSFAAAWEAAFVTWKAFLSAPPEPRLDDHEALGLWGELTLLHQVMASTLDPLKALRGWRGPAREAWDFDLRSAAASDDGRIEVKTTLGRKRAITVNNWDQLQLETGQAWLVLLEAERSPPTGGVSLVELVEHGMKGFGRSALEAGALTVEFSELLVAARYRPEHEDHYRLQTFHERNRLFFSVDSKFPIIRRSELAPETVVRVLDLKYTLSLQGLEPVDPPTWLQPSG